ncbi:MAG: rhodanese-like domain-containing protein [Roseibacillus sp.]
MIARTVIESLAIVALSGGAAVGTWVFTGGPQREVKCDPENLKPGYICFADAEEMPAVVWVDARTRELWELNGYPNSVLLTDHPSEDFPSLMAEAFESLATAETVVVYCATEGCGSSEPVSQKIRELELIPEGQIFVLAGGWKALGL